MGIKGLTKLLTTSAAASIKQSVLSKYTGRTIAIDASMLIYQFLVAIRSTGPQYNGAMLMNADGDITSHLMGMFTRTIRLMEHGIRPVYVFDGKPPEMKSGELEKRQENREKAEEELAKAKEEGDQEQIEKLSKRTVHMNQTHIDDCIKLLTLMGIPVVVSPSEAESQCAELVKKNKCWAMASEDMDSLTFGVPRLLRHLTQSEGKEADVLEFDYQKVLEELKLTSDSFIDLCILCGCDYCESIRGIGPVRALQYVQQYKSIEEIINHLDKSKYTIPEKWMYKESRELFKNPDVIKGEDIKIEYKPMNKEGIVSYLCDEKGFNKDRVLNNLSRLEKAKDKANQRRMDSFFKPVESTSTPKKKAAQTKPVAIKKRGKK